MLRMALAWARAQALLGPIAGPLVLISPVTLLVATLVAALLLPPSPRARRPLLGAPAILLIPQFPFVIVLVFGPTL